MIQAGDAALLSLFTQPSKHDEEAAQEKHECEGRQAPKIGAVQVEEEARGPWPRRTAKGKPHHRHPVHAPEARAFEMIRQNCRAGGPYEAKC